MNLSDAVYYLKRYLTRDDLARLSKHGVSLTGPTGLRRWVAERDFEAFMKVYFPTEFTLDFPDIHRQFIADIQDMRARRLAGRPGIKLARAIPRGHAKSTFFARMLPLWAFVTGWSPLTVLLGNNTTAARRLLKNIKETCEQNDALREDFPGLGAGGVWGEDRIEYQSAAIACFGAGSGAIRGVSKPNARPALVIGDDLDDDESVRSTVLLEAHTEWWRKAVMALGDQVGFTTSYVFVGTIIRETSLMWTILSRPDFESVVQRGVTRFADNAALWDAWRDWFREQTGAGAAPKDAASDTFYQQHKAAMLQGAEVLWERPDAYYNLMRYRMSNGEAAFQSEIQNDPGALGGSLGKLRFIDRLPDGPYQRFAALDSTIKGGKGNDLAAWVELLFYPRTRQMVVSFVNGEQRPYNATIDFVVDRLKGKERYSGLWVETNGAGAIVADLLTERIQQAGLYYDPDLVHNAPPKQERIQVLPEYVARNQLLVLADVDDELRREYDGWPGYRFDDVIDALATIVIQLKAAGLLDVALPEDFYAYE